MKVLLIQNDKEKLFFLTLINKYTYESKRLYLSFAIKQLEKGKYNIQYLITNRLTGEEMTGKIIIESELNQVSILIVLEKIKRISCNIK